MRSFKIPSLELATLKIKDNYWQRLHWQDFRLKICFEGILIGIIVGMLIMFFRYSLEFLEAQRLTVYALLAGGGFGLSLIWFVLLAIIGLLVGYLIKKEPLAGGSGVPEVKGILSGHLKMNWLKVITARFVGGILAIGAGLSLGRAGPSIQMGAAVGQGFSKVLGRKWREEKYLITSGVSAGLAAAFNAPLAGAFFAMEEVHKRFSPAILMSTVSASLSADFVTRYVFGEKPVFEFPHLAVLPFSYYGYLLGLGIAAGLLGVLFNKVLLKSLNCYEAIVGIPKILLPILPLISGGALGFILPQVLGGGSELINVLNQSRFSLRMLIILLLAKFVFTMLSYGSGAPGGIFLPLLVVGALAGDIYGRLLIDYGQADPLYFTNFVVLAMAACFSAIVKAPITGSILIAEMTASFEQLPALITVSMMAYIVTDLLNSQPIYDLLYQRRLAKKGMGKEISAAAGERAAAIAGKFPMSRE